MAKKKSRKQVAKAPQPKVATIFDCPLCGHKKCVFVKLDRNSKSGKLQCKICRFRPYFASIKSLDEEIDVYFYWVEALKKENKNNIKEAEEPKEDKKEVDEHEFDVD